MDLVNIAVTGDRDLSVVLFFKNNKKSIYSSNFFQYIRVVFREQRLIT